MIPDLDTLGLTGTSTDKVSSLVHWLTTEGGALGAALGAATMFPSVRAHLRDLTTMDHESLDSLLGEVSAFVLAMQTDPEIRHPERHT